MHNLILLLTSVFAVTAMASEPKLPYSPSLDLTSMDREVAPCQDFFAYACGTWIKKNPIPSDQDSWDVYAKLTLDNEKFIRELLEQSAKPTPQRTANEQKIGDFFAACMNESAVEQAGLTPIAERLKAIAEIKSLRDLSKVLMREHALGGDALFALSADPDYSDSSHQIAFFSAGALGLPDRDYYTKTDKKSVEIRARYLEFLASSRVLLGASPEQAKRDARGILRLETALAKAMLTRVQARDPRTLFHKMPAARLAVMVPGFAWAPYLQDAGVSAQDVVNVTEPKYFAELGKQLKKTPLAVWRALLQVQLLHEQAPFIAKAYTQANFAFYGKFLGGVPEQRPRWRRCASWTDEMLGEALGEVFVAKTFSPDTKTRTLKITEQVEEAMASEVKAIPWMGNATQAEALAKLHALTNKIGYPDRWRDYSALEIKREGFFANVVRANVFEVRRMRAKIGKPVDRAEWKITPPSVNAYYDLQANDIVFPAGVLQPPLFDPKMDAAPNYGDTGGTIGHELTHGFDDQGRHFDSKGNLRDWWRARDAHEFETRAKCVSDQYSEYVAVDDVHVNGKLTNGEDIADLGGTRLAYLAWKHATESLNLEPRDGLTPDQRFFIGMAQWACGSVRPETARVLAISDPHSPNKYRVNGVVANLPEFAQAFHCKKGEAMVRPAEKLCRIW